MKSLYEIQCAYFALCEGIKLEDLSLKERLVKANYKLELANINVELARMAGTELDFALAVYKKAKAYAKVAEVVAAGIRFELEANRRLEELELEAFQAAQAVEGVIEVEFTIVMPPSEADGEFWRWDMTPA